jgi:DNA-binding transcriptional LysR family regulator
MPLTTVSRKVSELEAHLRTKLINRTSRQLTQLTPAAPTLPLQANSRDLRRSNEPPPANMAPRGDPVTAPLSSGACTCCRSYEFLKAYPDIDIRIVLADRVMNLHEDATTSQRTARCLTAASSRHVGRSASSAAARIIFEKGTPKVLSFATTIA